MGRAKAWMMEQEDRGYWSVGTKYVCARCAGDSALKKFINKSAEFFSCSYCSAKSKKEISVHFDTLAKFMLDGLSTEYGEPNNEGVAWDEGWVGDVYSTYELLTEEIFLEVNSEQLMNDILQSLGDRQWCQKDFYGLTHSQALKFGWTSFCNVIKHKARYVFLQIEDSDGDDDPDQIPACRFLEEFGRIVKKLKLVRKLAPGTELYRLRVHGADSKFSAASELGSPPKEFCRFPNRMSPAGISMFYGAPEKETCIAETYAPDGKDHYGTFGKFKNSKELILLDMTRMPRLPSIFEPNSSEMRHSIIFLMSFLRDFTKPVTKDGREHIDYVPTQVISEYVRHVLKTKGKSVDGIVYKSSRLANSEAVVIFVDAKGCVDIDETADGADAKLILTEVSRIRLKKPTLRRLRSAGSLKTCT